MSVLTPLVASDPASTRLTVYDEAAGTRMEFSAITLDNWANKIANMLIDEFDAPTPPSSSTFPSRGRPPSSPWASPPPG